MINTETERKTEFKNEYDMRATVYENGCRAYKMGYTIDSMFFCTPCDHVDFTDGWEDSERKANRNN